MLKVCSPYSTLFYPNLKNQNKISERTRSMAGYYDLLIYNNYRLQFLSQPHRETRQDHTLSQRAGILVL